MREAVINKENIKVLIVGRKNIDAHIALKASLNAERSNRSASDKDSDHTKSVTVLNEWFKDHEFESLDDFVKWNNEMELAEIKECLEYVQVCDHCKGYKGKPPCIQTCGEGKSWYDKWTGSKEQYDYLYKLSLEMVEKYSAVPKWSKESVTMLKDDAVHSLIDVDSIIANKEKIKGVGDTYKTGYCPSGHGFVIKIKKITEFPHWSMY